MEFVKYVKTKVNHSIVVAEKDITQVNCNFQKNITQLIGKKAKRQI